MAIAFFEMFDLVRDVARCVVHSVPCWSRHLLANPIGNHAAERADPLMKKQLRMCALSVRVALTGLARPQIAKVALQSHMEGTLHAGHPIFVRCVARRTKQQSHVGVDGKAAIQFVHRNTGWQQTTEFCSHVMIVLCGGGQGANMNVMCSYWHFLGEANGCRRASGDAA